MARKEILGHYSPEEITVSIAGLFTLEGFAEGSFVTIARDSPLFSTRETSDGRVSRTKNSSSAHTVSITLMGTAESNDTLSRLSQLDHSTHIAKFPLFIKDELGSTLFFASSAWVEDSPDVSFGLSVTDRVWVLKCAQASLYVGGNEEESGMVEDVFNAITGHSSNVRQIFL